MLRKVLAVSLKSLKIFPLSCEYKCAILSTRYVFFMFQLTVCFMIIKDFLVKIYCLGSYVGNKRNLFLESQVYN